MSRLDTSLALTHSASRSPARLIALALTAALALPSALTACASGDVVGGEGAQGSEELVKRDAEGQESAPGAAQYFSFTTPLGERLLERSRAWEREQVLQKEEFAQPRMCAHNVSEVLEQAGLYSYSDYLVPNMLSAVKARGGLVFELDTRDKQGVIASLNARFGGRLPVGALVNGCLNRDCSGDGGDGHIAILGHTDPDGVVWLYHNNWYRPDNEGGEWREHMVSREYYYDLGLRRQWMATPWIQVERDPATGELVDVVGLLPQIDDLDPFTGYFITISIMPELLAEVDDPAADHLFCPAGAKADAPLGVCVLGAGDEALALGPFSNKMQADCAALGEVCDGRVSLSGEGPGQRDYSVGVTAWPLSLYRELRGDGVCPRGLSLDADIGRCAQPSSSSESGRDEVFGPFPVSVVARCQTSGGGNACATARWSKGFYLSVR
jgi:hypothetical protein